MQQSAEAIGSLTRRLADIETREDSSTFSGALGANTLTSDDADSVHYLGRAAIGYNGTDGDDATFAHRDHMSATGFALRQDQLGNTEFNAAAGGTLTFSDGGSAFMDFYDGDLDLKSTGILSNNSDSVFTLGRVSFGYDGTNSDQATFAHRDHMVPANNALRQASSGSTVLNAASAGILYLRHGNADRAQIASSFNFLDTPITSNDADTDYIFGRSQFSSPTSDEATFSHRDQSSTTGYALKQSAAGNTFLNAASGRTLYLRVGHAARLEIATSLNLVDTPIISSDADTAYTLGRAHFDGSVFTDELVLSHRDHSSTTAYALRQSSSGSTVLNGPSSVRLRTGNNDRVLIGSSFDFVDTPITSNDADTAYTLGRATIDGSLFTDNLTLSHRDCNTTTEYAFRQTGGGATVVNAKSSSALYLRSGNTDRMSIATDINLVETAVTSNDADTAYTFGRAKFDGSVFGDELTLSHRDLAATTTYALRQTASGSTILNTGASSTLHLRRNNISLVQITSDVDFLDTAISSDDADTAYDFGRARVGYVNFSDTAGFCHRDHTSTTGCGFRQNAAGDVVINAPTGQRGIFRINNVTKMEIDGTDIDFSDTPITSDDADTQYEFGRAEIGYGGSDVASFSHRDYSTSASYALEQNASGHTSLNSVSGGQTWIRSNDANKIRVTTTDIRMYDDVEPWADTGVNLGSSSLRYNDAYVANGVTTTSDIAEKRDVRALSLGMNFLRKLEPIEYRWNEGKRRHFGLSAQQVKATIDDLGIDSKDFAAYIEPEDGPAGLRYQQFIPMLISAVNELSAEVEALKKS